MVLKLFCIFSVVGLQIFQMYAKNILTQRHSKYHFTPAKKLKILIYRLNSLLRPHMQES